MLFPFDLSHLNFAATLFSSLYLCGLIWTIQVVHYPLFSKVGESNFAHYEASHVWRITLIVFPAMALEQLTGLILIFYPPGFVTITQAVFLFGLIQIAWLSTMLIQVPLHNKLTKKFSHEVVQKLVLTNWIRTIAWTARSLALLYFLLIALSK
jgi:hypothetical protein